MDGDRPRIVVIGDLVDDIVVTPLGAVRADTDTPSSIERRPGGSAANTAAWIAGDRERVALVARCAADDLDRHAAALRAVGVEPLLEADPARPTGTIVIIVEGDRRTMLTQRGANEALSPDALTDEVLATAAFVHTTGYTVVGHEAAFAELVDRAHACGVSVSLNVGSVGAIADAGLDRFAAAIAGVDVLLANLAEGRLLTGVDEPEDVAGALTERFAAVALTLGALGAIVGSRANLTRIDTRPAPAVDPTGAGDAFAAGFVAALAGGATPADAGARGARLAARAIALVGGRPG